MPRFCQAVLLFIVVLAGFTVHQLFAPAAFTGESGDSTGERGTALAFYAAMNSALDGGGTSALESLLSGVFVDHDADSGASRSAADFLAEVRALGTEPRGMRMDVISVESFGANLVVGIREAQTEPMRAAGLVVEQSPAAPHFEVLRIERGRIIDRWSPGIGQTRVSEKDGIVLHGSGQTDFSTTLERVVIPAGVIQRWYAVGPQFMSIESGSATLRIDHFERGEETFELERGAAVDIGSADQVWLRSSNDEPVSALVYSIVRRSAAGQQVPAGAQSVENEGVTHVPLWRGSTPPADAGTEHRLATIAVPAGVEMRLSGATTAAVLIAVDRGVVEIGSPVEDLDPDSIDASRAAFLTGAGEIILRNVSQQDVTIVLVVIRAEPQSGPAIG